jgi:hypothetical protein
MTRTPVQSTTLASIGYDPKQRLLEIEFRRGGVYHYRHVPPNLYQGLMKSTSKGAYFASQIKPVFPWSKLQEP